MFRELWSVMTFCIGFFVVAVSWIGVRDFHNMAIFCLGLIVMELAVLLTK